LSSTRFKKPSVHPQEDLYTQFYGGFFSHASIYIFRCMRGGKKTMKLHVQVFLRMNTWLSETCRRQHNWVKSLMKDMCILLVLITYGHIFSQKCQNSHKCCGHWAVGKYYLLQI